MRYLLATLGFVLLIVVIIVLLTSSGSHKVTTSGGKTIKLMSFVTKPNAQIRYTIDGPINASESHRSVQISISPTSRNLTVLQGYQGSALVNQSYPNNQQSYSDFLAALMQVNFTAERSVSSSLSRQSVCPLGNRSRFEIIDGTKDVMDLWTASCSSGSFAGNIPQTTNLFRTQIPDYDKLTSTVSVTGTVSSSIF
ncbi:MAG: hypothetical protein ABI221_01665 [Candidatus Saccharimonadales bacterium]